MGKNQDGKPPKEEPSDENLNVKDQSSTEPDESVGDTGSATEEKPKESAKISVRPGDMKDLEKFIEISLVTGDLPPNYQETFSEADKERFLEKFISWKKTGKQKPSLPKESAKYVEKIIKVYRARDKGEEYLYYVIEGQALPVGIKKTPIYRKYDDGHGMVEDKSMQIGVTESYEIDYSEEEARRLIKKATRDTSNPKFYLKDGIGDSYIKTTIRNPDNFFRPFNELLAELKAGTRL